MKIKQTVTVTLNTEFEDCGEIEVLISQHASVADILKQAVKDWNQDRGTDPDTVLSEDEITSLVITWSVARD